MWSLAPTTTNTSRTAGMLAVTVVPAGTVARKSQARALEARCGDRVTVAGVVAARAGESCDMPGLDDLNALPAQDFEELLLRCCAAPGWARRVTRGRPYSSLADLLGVAGAAWAARES